MSVLGYNSFPVLWIVILVNVVLFTEHVHSTDYCRGKFKRCICTDDFVECHNQQLPTINVLYHYIRDDVVNVTITGSNFTELPQNVLGSFHSSFSLRLHKLKRLDLSNNHIQFIHGKFFHCMQHLEELNLSNNKWKRNFKNKYQRYFTSLPELKHLDLTNAFDEVWNGSTQMMKLESIFYQTDMNKLETLKLGHNKFFSLSVEAANTMCNMRSLATLDLSYNNLVSPSLPTENGCLEKLTTLDLSYNKMKRLSREFLEKVSNLSDLKSVKLAGNPFNCDCRLLDTWYWLNSSAILADKSRILCENGYKSSFIKKRVLDIMPAELMCQSSEVPLRTNTNTVKTCTSTVVVIGLVSAVLGLTLMAFLIVIKVKVERLAKRMPKMNFPFRKGTGFKNLKEIV